ncbi:SAVED domain-containing protein [Marinifilum caeruleilacunae]|uniref:SAVED domain-containing protein n=1 Tax=Marinifilum caeruleilacunae TaxID=2499076 RepID=A0ABX1WS23_9BACT|nr:SAVED domain-containing protein [Marinifilum caeruleilacunae]NOU58888.1 SAVED domain-containing protein [Marinifilum caeruleilacunae]
MTKKQSNSRPSIPVLVKTQLWTSSAGRCQFEGCNKPLWRHGATMNQMNISYIAHIYAYSPNGPRYDEVLSPKLEIDFSNLMLVCDECHRLIDDKKREDEFSAIRLIQMKKDHEERIELLTGISPDKKSHIVLFGAKVGTHDTPLSYNRVREAVIPNYFPAEYKTIDLGMHNTLFEDDKEIFWEIQRENLNNQFSEKLKYLEENSPHHHYSIFALAPQPLLIQLGTLLNDIYPAEVYQLHREPSTWKWLDETELIKFRLVAPDKITKKVALKFELSATITDDRIESVLGEDTSIWSIKIDSPSNDFLRTRNQLMEFRKLMRYAFDEIKAKHGQDTVLNIFPSMPVATAVELGRVWMPKADMGMLIYDQNSKRKGFVKTIEIKPN